MALIKKRSDMTDRELWRSVIDALVRLEPGSTEPGSRRLRKAIWDRLYADLLELRMRGTQPYLPWSRGE